MESANGRNRNRIALVIGSGAVKCAAALGSWKVLAREGIEIDMLVGCSGGSLFATTMALGYEVEACIEKTRQLWNREITARRDLSSLLRALLPGVLNFDERFGMVSDRAMLSRLREVFGERTFADVKTPLYLLATDFHQGDAVVLTEGRLVDALRASISIPYIWAPWQIGDRLLVDGSLSNPMPVDVAIKEGVQVILAMGFQSPLPRKVKTISRFAFHVNGIMTNNLYKANFAFHNLAHHAEIIPILPEFDRPVSLFDTDQFPYVIEQGERATEALLPYIHRLLEALEPVDATGRDGSEELSGAEERSGE
ncbi:MAG TPA: patatin-like phospholipase family protein [Anaerolineales bacterium]